MDLMGATFEFKTIELTINQEVCFVRFDRQVNSNTINNCMVEEFYRALEFCTHSAKIVVLEGSEQVFCLGSDFGELNELYETDQITDPTVTSALYDVWHRLATGPFISIAHVRGKVNAGGVGFVAACDIVLAETNASFGLSELLFGLMPACVLPFLIRRIGVAKSNYLTLTTQVISAEVACQWGLVDAVDPVSSNLLRKQLLRLRRISASSIKRYKSYIGTLDLTLNEKRNLALLANRDVFSDSDNLEKISRYVKTGLFPWE